MCFIVVMILIANHVVACSWFWIGASTDPENQSWVNKAKSKQAWNSLVYRYATSLHWSLTQFTPSSMEVVPMNTKERIFAVCVLLFALIVFSSFVMLIEDEVAETEAVYNFPFRMYENRKLRRFGKIRIRHRRRNQDRAIPRYKKIDIDAIFE